MLHLVFCLNIFEIYPCQHTHGSSFHLPSVFRFYHMNITQILSCDYHTRIYKQYHLSN